jgi:hypothetical protein
MYKLGMSGVQGGNGDREEALEWLRTATAKEHKGALMWLTTDSLQCLEQLFGRQKKRGQKKGGKKKGRR